MKSVKSINPCQSVILTIYDIAKVPGGELRFNATEGTEFIIVLPV